MVSFDAGEFDRDRRTSAVMGLEMVEIAWNGEERDAS